MNRRMAVPLSVVVNLNTRRILVCLAVVVKAGSPDLAGSRADSGAWYTGRVSRSAQITAALDQLVDQGYLPGYAFAVHDSGGLHQGCGGFSDIASGDRVVASTAFRIASLSKLIGAIVTLQQVEAGVLSLDDPIRQWIPELARPTGPDGRPTTTAITVRHLLTMTSGWGVLSVDDSHASALAERGLAPGPFAPSMTAEDFLARLAQVRLAAQPGQAWRYHTSTDVLSILLERLTGRRNEDLVRTGIAEPLNLGMLSFEPAEHDTAVCYRATPTALVPLNIVSPGFQSYANGLVTRPADYVRVLDQVSSDQPTILRSSSARAIRSVQLTDAQRHSAGPMLDPWASYGYQVSVNVQDTPAYGSAGSFGWTGGTGCVAGADPAARVSAVYLGTRGMGSPGVPREFDVFWKAVNG